ncbi:unnamed protein product [Lepeophtheirus salmonis]|uniref:(salmon louse) hypothetical protein n=1 Tax=Lepeophtheirus salmonis TaxID=72036 RepID=A0A7R8CA93_LEPSM|nr:unnamed protein product [Lepeophtheirus salmonis]CAF2749085.1 unnamed protein product [Lepeophtheirus salmonis]
MRNLLKISLILFISYSVDSYPKESATNVEEEESISSSTFRTAQTTHFSKAKCSDNNNINSKQTPEEKYIRNETLIEETTESEYVINTSLSYTDTHDENNSTPPPSIPSTFYTESPMEKITSSLVTESSSESGGTSIYLNLAPENEMNIEESRETTLPSSPDSEKVITYTTTLPMIYTELITESPQSDFNSVNTIMSSSNTSPSTITTIRGLTTIPKYLPITTKHRPVNTLLRVKRPRNQNDAHWDVSMDDMDFTDYEESVQKEKSRLNNVQLMDGGVQDSMTIVLTPIKYVSDAMVHIKYKRISKDPTEEMSKESSDTSDPGRLEMSHDVSFPLLNEENKRNLDNLPEGWYYVCAEVTKFDKITTAHWNHCTDCFGNGQHCTSLSYIIIYNKLQNSRRKKKDKEMQDRVQKMAQKEKELNEQNKPAFHHIYVDPDEPYEERCIM